MDLVFDNFYELKEAQLFDVYGGINWYQVAKSALISGTIGAIGMGTAGAGCGTVVLPVIGTVSVGFVCAVGGFVGGSIYGAGKSILNQVF